MITLSKIAKLAHVSVSTASKAFSMSSEVSEQTRQEIFRIAKDYGCFKKFYNAKYPKYVIAVICPEFHGRYYSSIIAVLLEQLRSKNCEMCVAATNFSKEVEQELLEYYHNYANVDGIIVIGGKVPIADTCEIPVVSLVPNSRQTAGVNLQINYTPALTQVIRHFTACGIREIGFIGEPYTIGKQNVFRAAMRREGLPCDHVVSGKRFEMGGYLSMKHLLSGKTRPRAVVCAYDHLAIGAMRCIADHGLSVPEDIAIVGMDDLPEAEFLNPSLSSIDFCIEESCHKAVDCIVQLLSGNQVAGRHVFLAELKLRGSTQLPPREI